MTDLTVALSICQECGSYTNTWGGLCYSCIKGGTSRPANKYGAIRTEADGRTFDSKGEAGRAHMLQLMERNGEISNLEYQVVYQLSKRVRAVIDFRYVENGQTVLEDFKGCLTDSARIKYAWLEQKYGQKVTLYPPREKK
jgi:hypothetical protein